MQREEKNASQLKNLDFINMIMSYNVVCICIMFHGRGIYKILVLGWIARMVVEISKYIIFNFIIECIIFRWPGDWQSRVENESVVYVYVETRSKGMARFVI